MMPLQEFVSVWVRDPRIQKEDFWHSYIDYEICIHVSMQSVVMEIILIFSGICLMGYCDILKIEICNVFLIQRIEF